MSKFKLWQITAAALLVVVMGAACSRPSAKPDPVPREPVRQEPVRQEPVQPEPVRQEPPVPPQPRPRPAGGKAYELAPAPYGYDLRVAEQTYVESSLWLGDSRILMEFMTAVPGALTDGGTVLMDLATGTVQPVRNIGRWWFFSPFLWDDRTVANMAYEEPGQHFRLTDLESGSEVARWPLGEYVLALKRQPGKANVVYSLRHKEHTVQHLGALKALDVASGKTWEIAPVGWPVGFLADGRLIFHRGERAGELAVVAVEPGAVPEVIHPGAVGGVISPDGKQAAFLYQAGTALLDLLMPRVAHASPTRVGRPPNPKVDTLAIWEAAGGKIRSQKLPFPGFREGLYWSADSRELAAVIEEHPLEDLHRDASRRAGIVRFGQTAALVESAERQISGYGWSDGRFFFRLRAGLGESRAPIEAHTVAPDGSRGSWHKAGVQAGHVPGGYSMVPDAGGMQIYLFGKAERYVRSDWPRSNAMPFAVWAVSPAGWALVAEGPPDAERILRFVKFERQ